MKKNFTWVIGWLAFLISFSILHDVTVLTSFFLIDQVFSKELPSIVSATIYLLCIFSSGFIGFVFSVKWIVLPISGLDNGNSNNRHNSLILDWFSFCFYFILYCWPILIFRIFSGLFPSLGNIEEFVTYGWEAIASLLIYRRAANAVLLEASVSSEEAELQSANP